jgi:hypothetical protein
MWRRSRSRASSSVSPCARSCGFEATMAQYGLKVIPAACSSLTIITAIAASVIVPTYKAETRRARAYWHAEVRSTSSKVLAEVLALVNKVDSYDDLRSIGNALNARGRVLQGQVARQAVVDKGLSHGDPVSFMVSGTKRFGTVRTVNPKTCTVDVVGGGSYRVPPQMLTREASLPAPAAKRSEDEILEQVKGIYCQLSPEALTCDGELPRNQVIAKERRLRGELHTCFRELGRTVSEAEVFRSEFGGTAFPRPA